MTPEEAKKIAEGILNRCYRWAHPQLNWQPAMEQQIEEALQSAYEQGRQSILSKWPSEEEIDERADHDCAEAYGDLMRWTWIRLSK